jgi:Trk K+ transport system NAD-binding subunit
LPESLCGKPITELADGERFRPVMVTRGGRARLCAPGLVGQEGDIVHLAVREDALEEVNRRLGAHHAPPAGTAAAPVSGVVGR